MMTSPCFNPAARPCRWLALLKVRGSPLRVERKIELTSLRVLLLTLIVFIGHLMSPLAASAAAGSVLHAARPGRRAVQPDELLDGFGAFFRIGQPIQHQDLQVFEGLGALAAV